MAAPSKDPERREVPNIEALVEFFRDLPSEKSLCRFEGMDFDVAQDERGLFLAATLVVGLGATSVTESLLRTRPKGIFARLFFGRSAAIDLVVSPQRDRLTEDFVASYQVSALVPPLAERFLGDSLPSLLAALWPRYHIDVRDEFLDVGALGGTPEESAEVIRDLVAAMSEAHEEDSPLSVDELAGLDSFCFYCGHPVASSTPTCPSCDGDLTED